MSYRRRQNKNHIDNFRNSREWKDRIRPYILTRDNYLCQECKRNGRVTAGNEVHHIKPLHSHWELRATASNLETLCSDCHTKIDYELEYGKVKARLQDFIELWNESDNE